MYFNHCRSKIGISEELIMRIQAPRGTKDILPDDQQYFKYIQGAVDKQAEINGYEKIETPIFEYEGLYQKGTGIDSDIVKKEMYEVRRAVMGESGDRIHHQEKERLILRPEYTPGIVRAYLQHGMRSWPQPVQLYYFGPVFRYNRPQRGRLRQFWQFGFELIGADMPATDARMISLIVGICKQLKIKDYAILINSIGCNSCRPTIKAALINYFTNKKAILCEDCRVRLEKNPLRILDCKNKTCQKLAKESPPIVDQICQKCRDHFKQVLEFLDEAEISYDLDPTLVRGLDYYTRTTFELIIKSDSRRQNSLGGGGRYDNLIKLYGGKNTPAVGVAFGVERVIEVLKNQKIKIEEAEKPQIFIAQLGEEAKKKAISLLELLQNEEISVRAALSKSSLKSQLKLANKLNVRITIIFGQREVVDGTAIIRDMKEGVQEIAEQEEILDRVKRRLNIKI